MRGIRLLLDRNLPLKLKTVPTTINRHEVYEMQRMAEEDFGVDFKFDPLVNPRTDCSQSPLASAADSGRRGGARLSRTAAHGEYQKLVGPRTGVARRALNLDNVYNCGGGVTSCAIDPYGADQHLRAFAPGKLRLALGQLPRRLGRFPRACAQQKKTRQTKCDSCRIHTLCGMCAANGELEKGDAESPVEFLCEVAHLRAMALDVVVPAHGECECCAGGVSHETWRSAERIRKGEKWMLGHGRRRSAYVPAADLAAEFRLRKRLRFLRGTKMSSESQR